MQYDNIQEFSAKSPGKRLAILGRLSMSYLAGSLKELGVARGQIGFLLTVLQHEGVCQEELSELLFIDKAATARGLLELENKDLVRREPDEQDRRKKRIYSTDKCRALQADLLTVLQTHNNVLFRGLSTDEQNQCLTLLDTLISNLRSAIKEDL